MPREIITIIRPRGPMRRRDTVEYKEEPKPEPDSHDSGFTSINTAEPMELIVDELRQDVTVIAQRLAGCAEPFQWESVPVNHPRLDPPIAAAMAVLDYSFRVIRGKADPPNWITIDPNTPAGQKIIMEREKNPDLSWQPAETKIISLGSPPTPNALALTNMTNLVGGTQNCQIATIVERKNTNFAVYDLAPAIPVWERPISPLVLFPDLEASHPVRRDMIGFQNAVIDRFRSAAVAIRARTPMNSWQVRMEDELRASGQYDPRIHAFWHKYSFHDPDHVREYTKCIVGDYARFTGEQINDKLLKPLAGKPQDDPDFLKHKMYVELCSLTGMTWGLRLQTLGVSKELEFRPR